MGWKLFLPPPPFLAGRRRQKTGRKKSFSRGWKSNEGLNGGRYMTGENWKIFEVRGEERFSSWSPPLKLLSDWQCHLSNCYLIGKSFTKHQYLDVSVRVMTQETTRRAFLTTCQTRIGYKSHNFAFCCFDVCCLTYPDKWPNARRIKSSFERGNIVGEDFSYLFRRRHVS